MAAGAGVWGAETAEMLDIGGILMVKLLMSACRATR